MTDQRRGVKSEPEGSRKEKEKKIYHNKSKKQDRLAGLLVR